MPPSTPPSTRILLLAFVATSFAANNAIAQQVVVEETVATAQFALADIFSDHMVLQRDKQIPIWGTAPAGTVVKLLLADETHTTTADADGKWRVLVGPLATSASPLEMIASVGDKHLRVNDVLVGEVWMAGGQSNMEWIVENTNRGNEVIATADLPTIRQIKVKHTVNREPQESLPSDGWEVCTPETAGNFSAVAFYFALELQEKFNVPIGLLNCNWGGTRMEPWASREALEKSATFAPAVEAADRHAADPDYKTPHPQQAPSVLSNAMLNPLVGYGIRGAIWYQGESNSGEAKKYRELSEIMIGDWRARWQQGDFPFLFVQLSAWQPGGDRWPLLREAQLQTLEVPNTGMAVSVDIGHRTDIHPRNKTDVGLRLALWAQKLAYGKDLVYSGPIYREMSVVDGKAILQFDHTGGGLQAKGGKLRGFEICETDREFVPADAKIEGDHLVVWDHKVRDPVAVRYSWSSYPDGNLYNAEQLPASPFRTDKF